MDIQAVTPEGSAADYTKCDAMRVDWEEENCDDETLYTYSGHEEEISESQTSKTDTINWGS